MALRVEGGSLQVSAVPSADITFDSAATATVSLGASRPLRLTGIEASNVNSSDVFLQLFDLPVSEVTLGTTKPKMAYLIPKGDGTNRGALTAALLVPIAFGRALSYACTTTPTGSVAPGTAINLNLAWRALQ